MMTSEEKINMTRQMFNDWEARDWDSVLGRFAENGALHSMMSDPVVGHDALKQLFDGFTDLVEALTIDIEHIGIVDDVVVTIRVDRPTVRGKQGRLPAVGVFEYDSQGKILLWREYFDRPTMLSEMGAGEDWA